MKNHRYGNFTVKKTSPALKRMRMKIKAQKKQIKSNRRGVFVIGKTDTSVSEVHQKLPKLVFLHSSHGVAAYQMLLTISSCCGSDFPSWMLCSCKKCSASSAAIQPDPAAVMACLYFLSWTSPAAKTPGTFVCVVPGFVSTYPSLSVSNWPPRNFEAGSWPMAKKRPDTSKSVTIPVFKFFTCKNPRSENPKLES
jgi:hypothetical protein